MHAELDPLPEGGRQGGTRTVRVCTVSVSRTVTKQIITFLAKYTAMLDMVYVRVMQLFNRRAFTYATTLSRLLDKSHSCLHVTVTFSSQAWTVTKH